MGNFYCAAFMHTMIEGYEAKYNHIAEMYHQTGHYSGW